MKRDRKTQNRTEGHGINTENFNTKLLVLTLSLSCGERDNNILNRIFKHNTHTHTQTGHSVDTNFVQNTNKSTDTHKMSR